MESLVEAHNKFPRRQLDSPHSLSRKHTGSSSLSLSLSTSGPRAGQAVAPTLSTTTVSSTDHFTSSAPITTVRPIKHSRSTDTFAQQCTDPSPLSTSGRYLQPNFTISPLERAARAESSSLFESLHSKKLDIPRTVATPPQSQHPSPKNTPRNDNGSRLFEKIPVNPRPKTDSVPYDHPAREPRRVPECGIIRRGERHDGGCSNAIDTRCTNGSNYRAVEPSSLFHGSRRRFLAPGPFEALMEDQNQMSSLTSDSTVASPFSEALATPPDSECSDFYAPSIKHPTRSQSFHSQPVSLGETSAWPRPLEQKHRNRSCNFEGSQPQVSQRKRRAFSEKRLSPASQFLSGWRIQKAPEPDDEGQEVGAYVIGKQIGFGGFSVVKEAMTIKNGVRIKRAVKIVRKKAHALEAENDKVQAEFDREVSIWRYLQHSHILPLIEVYDTPFATYCFTKLTTGGTLFSLLKANRQGLPIRLSQKFSYQLASAIRYLHEDVRIIHRDVKLENCLVDVSADEEGDLLLCDFGMAEQMRGSNDDDDDSDSENAAVYHNGHQTNNKGSHLHTHTVLKGSLQYASPEMVSSQAQLLTSAIDMWAFGVVVYTLFTGVLPFNHPLQPKLQALIQKGHWDVDAFRNSRAYNEDSEMGEMALDVVKGCLCVDPEMRWTVRMVLESDWLETASMGSP